MLNRQPNVPEERPAWSDEDTKPNHPVEDPRPNDEAVTENPLLEPPDGPPMPHNPVHPEVPPIGGDLPK